MKFTADTSFFVRLSEGNEKAIEFWKEICEGKGRLVIPTVVLVELKNGFLKKGLKKECDELLLKFDASSRITIVPLTSDLAKKAGGLSYTYNMTNFDAVVLATAIEAEYTSILTTDSIFLKAKKDGIVQTILL